MKQKPITSPALLVLALLALLASCAPKPAIPSAQHSVDSWKAMEKQAQGHSPRGQFQLAEPPVVIDRPERLDIEKRDAAKPLPTAVMSLRMHNADVVAVLQALSRAVGKSIVVSPGVVGGINVNFVQRPWDEVFRAILAANQLTYSFDGETIRVMARDDLQGQLDVASLKRKAQEERNAALADEPQLTSVAKVRFADAKQLQKTVENTLTKGKEGKAIGSVQVDELSNSLIIQGVEQDVEKIGKLLAKLDAPRSQIKLKAHIVETTREVARDLGILWGGGYTGDVRTGNKLGIGGGFAATTVAGTVSAGTATLGTTNLGAAGVRLPATAVNTSNTGAALDLTFGKVGGNILEAQLQALATDNKLNIISSPSIATMDNQKAYTESGERVPYQTVSGTGTEATYSVSFQDAVLRLEITPHIIDDQFIKLQVLIQKDEVDSSRTVSGNPYIVKKKSETTLIARNGETVVISGLSKLRNSLREAGVPGLKDVPGAGWLAKSESKADLKDEFMIFITPTVLADWRAGEVQKSFEEIDRETTSAREKAERRASGEDGVREFSSTSGANTVRVKEMPVQSLDPKSAAPLAPASPDSTVPPAYLQDMTTEPAPPAPAQPSTTSSTTSPTTSPATSSTTSSSAVAIKQMPTMAVPEQAATPYAVSIKDPALATGAAPDAAAAADEAVLNTRSRKPGLGGRR